MPTTKVPGRKAKNSSVEQRKEQDVSELENVFADPRNHRDRRMGDMSEMSEMERGSDSLSGYSCRRRGERRTAVYIKKDEWWMKRNYCNVEYHRAKRDAER